jgi:homoserine dehydrogenase
MRLQMQCFVVLLKNGIYDTNVAVSRTSITYRHQVYLGPGPGDGNTTLSLVSDLVKGSRTQVQVSMSASWASV